MTEPANTFVYRAGDEAGTERLGAALAGALPEPAVVALHGTLGAGKTRLVKAIATACGTPPEAVVSPTFVLCQEYRGRRTLFHLDAYRVADDEEFWQLGVDELFDAPAVTLVEWADRVSRSLPEERLEVHLEVTGPTSRVITVTAKGARYQPTIDALKRDL
jgi:tRNA threonylcarbamoyladenosine biosynthesis protein TsaE